MILIRVDGYIMIENEGQRIDAIIMFRFKCFWLREKIINYRFIFLIPIPNVMGKPISLLHN